MIKYLIELTDKIWEYIKLFQKNMKEYCQSNNQTLERADKQIKAIMTGLNNHQVALQEIMVILEAAGLAKKVSIKEVMDYKKDNKKETIH